MGLVIGLEEHLFPSWASGRVCLVPSPSWPCQTVALPQRNHAPNPFLSASLPVSEIGAGAQLHVGNDGAEVRVCCEAVLCAMCL